MNYSDVEIGQKVWATHNTTTQLVTVTGMSKGWVETTDLARKYRADQLELAATDEASDDEERDTPKLAFDLTRYEVGLAKTPSGRKSIDTNDWAAILLRGQTLDMIYYIAAEHMNACLPMGEKTTPELLKARYGHLNAGMQRMNLANRMRGAYNRAEDAKAAERKQADKI